jgi:glycosyltransferase involved in cell wall biosynthesis
MKILHLVSAGYEGGGAETLLFNLVQNQNHNNNVKVLSSDLKPNKHHFSDFEFRHINGGILKRLLLFIFNPYSYFKLRWVLNTFNPDVIHLHTMAQFSPSVLFLLKKYPTVMTVHGPEEFLRSMIPWTLPPNRFKHRDYRTLNLLGFLHYYFIYYIQHLVYIIGMKNVDLLLAPSQFIRQQILIEYKNTRLLYNGVTLRDSSEHMNNKKLLFVGGIKKIKGIKFLIKAMPLIIDKIPNVSLDIVGDGDDKNELIKLANDLKLQSRIKFLGWISNENLTTVYRNADVVVIPSIVPESFCLIGPEAMSVGRPIVGSNVGGIPEWLDDGKTGFLVDPGNSRQIAEKVIQLLSDRKLLEQMGKNARKKAEQFSIEKHADKIEKIYEELIEKYKAKESS